MKKLAVLLFASATALIAGCAGGLGSKDYSREQARNVQEVQMGVVEAVRAVKIEGTKSVVGGAAAEEAVTRQDGVEITVKLDSGRVLAITQAADEEFRVGDRVRVLTGGGVTRVTR